jgi:S-DNA-T family DNA segregation ATPase FtsK/SpoIIIE
VVELEAQTGSIRIAGPTPLAQEFVPDTVDSPHAREFACSLAPLRLPSQTDLSGLPSTVSLFDVLGIQRVEDLPVAELWRKHSASESLAVPVGLRRGGGDLILDLHERSQGPHALVAGIAGVGKSVLLQSLIASLAVHYHPHDIAFILIDFKGDGVASLFHDLPHQVGIITTTAGGMAARALSTLQQIIQRRQDLFRQAGVNDIDSYIRAYRQQKTGVPLPHLVVVIDEFHDLAQTYPDFMTELIKIVQSNRALGVHLLLSTARPAEIIDERIWNSVRLRLCLRTEHIEDSQRVIGRDVAAELEHPGRGYILVNRSDTFDLFQAAWAGGPYYPNGDNSHLVEVDEVDLSGRRRRLGPPPPESSQSQLVALVALLKQVAEQERITSVIGPWLSPPSETVTIESLRRGAAEGWDGNYWQPSSGWLTPIVGLVDDPVRRFQGPLHVALDEGPLALLGVAEAGKTTLLKSIVASLALSHTPSQVHLYILDFGEYLGRIFGELPHAVCATLPDQADELAKVVYSVLVELDRRKNLLVSLGVGTLAAYRKHTGDTIADIVVILEHYPQFVALYPALTSSLERLVNEGGPLGIHLILTAHDEAEIPTWLLTRIALTMTLDGPTLEAPRDASSQPVAHPSARTLLRRHADPDAALLPFQKALPAAGATGSDRNEALRGSAKAMASAWHGPTARDGLHEPDLFDGYERGLRQLLSQLPSASQEYSDALIYQQRLLENIEQSRLYGDTEERVADRAEIIHRLNELARLTLGTSFKALCGLLKATTL